MRLGFFANMDIVLPLVERRVMVRAVLVVSLVLVPVGAAAQLTRLDPDGLPSIPPAYGVVAPPVKREAAPVVSSVDDASVLASRRRAAEIAALQRELLDRRMERARRDPEYAYQLQQAHAREALLASRRSELDRVLRLDREQSELALRRQTEAERVNRDLEWQRDKARLNYPSVSRTIGNRR